MAVFKYRTGDVVTLKTGTTGVICERRMVRCMGGTAPLYLLLYTVNDGELIKLHNFPEEIIATSPTTSDICAVDFDKKFKFQVGSTPVFESESVKYLTTSDNIRVIEQIVAEVSGVTQRFYLLGSALAKVHLYVNAAAIEKFTP